MNTQFRQINIDMKPVQKTKLSRLKKAI